MYTKSNIKRRFNVLTIDIRIDKGNGRNAVFPFLFYQNKTISEVVVDGKGQKPE